MKEKLEKYNQTHILRFYDEIENKSELENQINQIDFELLNNIYANRKFKARQEEIKPINYELKENVDKQHLFKLGEEAIKAGKIAVCQMAGGQRN